MENPKLQLVRRLLQRANALQPYKKYDTAKPDDSDNFKKGTEFESFVVQRFSTDNFTLIEWRSDKRVDGIYPIMNRFPDLEFCARDQDNLFPFAVECKWKQVLYKGSISFSNKQLGNYRLYERITGFPTFIIVGLGDRPAFPAHVYIFPIHKLTSNTFSAFELEKYCRPQPHNAFNLEICTRNSTVVYNLS